MITLWDHGRRRAVSERSQRYGRRGARASERARTRSHGCDGGVGVNVASGGHVEKGRRLG